MVDLLTIYTVWLTAFSLSFTFLPLFIIKDWKRRGTAEGFSSVGLVLPILMMSCWTKHGILTNDKMNIFINTFNIIFFSGYIAAFAYYQPKRKYLYGQLAALAITIFGIFYYVNSHHEIHQPDVMGSIAAGTQILGLIGGIYDLKRAIGLQTMEYIPANLQFGMFAVLLQWAIFGIIIGNYYMAAANLAGLILNIVTLNMYFVYPPKTWRVPIFGVGGTEKPIDAKKQEYKKLD